MNKDKFKNFLNEVLPLRAEVAEVRSNTEDSKEPKVELELVNMIGRKAHTRHNNVFYDYDDKILYLAGCNLVIASHRNDEEEE